MGQVYTRISRARFFGMDPGRFLTNNNPIYYKEDEPSSKEFIDELRRPRRGKNDEKIGRMMYSPLKCNAAEVEHLV